MAASVLTVTVETSGLTKTYEVTGSIAVGAGDYSTGGNTLSLALSDVKAQRLPESVLIDGASKYNYHYAPGTSLANGKMLITDEGGELAAGAMPAGVVADTIQFRALWKGML